ncbi:MULTISPECIES: peptidase inhibitor family I36 protein [Streptomyces]|uniref:Peptidase inhibitor family I36 n=1 Tax=Streptomyces lycii TaxID=2654337 RepID=A0ABQ7FHX9_9ACTN|nr:MULTISPECIES: peptidase inhibitor family I36 protein [Streptomyces]KAF4408212.1 hypothetical protein GCU69_15315 [Streptomyces lycii]PGH46874.1 hypothetical protein CRI70_31575 [Streptomyces sp. Ru87]
MRSNSATRKLSLRTLSFLSLAGLALAAGATPAVADTASAEADACPFTDTLCLFEGTDYTGERFNVRSMVPGQAVCVDLVSHNYAGRAHSGINTNSRTAVLYSGQDCTGTGYPISGSVPSFNFAAQSVRVY